MSKITVRDARPGDHADIVESNLRLAEETEQKRLDPEVLGRGVSEALADPDRLKYWVAELSEPGGSRFVGQAAITREWSDWRGGWIWWFQSVYVVDEYRGQGVFRLLYATIRDTARESPDVIGLRLYVEGHNDRARRVYQSLGLGPSGYEVFEDIWPTGA
ncbi:N-acetyltransferase family protein [Tundrisphaera sp. TA3]|uniref:GNAT family N-acetyltransferase n=1 Tax=Tundrisphaera sp. TA3 TaxID=3435775 RepID=UPI003EB92FE5